MFNQIFQKQKQVVFGKPLIAIINLHTVSFRGFVLGNFANPFVIQSNSIEDARTIAET